MIYLFPYLQISLGVYGIYVGGPFVWTGFIILFLILPVVEILMQKIKFDPVQHKSKVATVSLLLTPFALTTILGFAFWRAQHTPSNLEVLGLILSTGTMLGAYGITSAHELVHRRELWLRAFGVYNLMLVNFAHWGLEHVFGHHKHVATPNDPATARKDEAVYPFWFRNYFGSLDRAWKISKRRVASYWAVTVVVSVLIGFVFGAQVLLVWLLSSLVAILLLQTVDYIEHYGLLRNQNQDGFYMAVKPVHSWDTSSIWTNITLFNLGFHSHHHMKAVVPYEDLQEQPFARRMPFGYSVMVPLSLFPFLFLPLMNKNLEISNELK